MSIVLLSVLAAGVVIAFLIWRATRVKPLLPSWKPNWGAVQFAETPYADILCGLAVEVRKKEGPYTFLKSETLSPETVFGSNVRVHYKSKGKTRGFIADQFPLQPNQAFEIYQTYRYFSDGGPPTLLLVAVPILAVPLKKREIKERRDTRSGELLEAWAERLKVGT